MSFKIFYLFQLQMPSSSISSSSSLIPATALVTAPITATSAKMITQKINIKNATKKPVSVI